MIFCAEFGSEAQKQSIALRYEVLRKPLGLHFEPAELHAEHQQVHILHATEALVTGVLLLVKADEAWKMRQVAVDPAFSNQGIGSALVSYSEDYVRQKQGKAIVLHARDTAVPFYLRLGYGITGDRFTEVGIPHFRMHKIL